MEEFARFYESRNIDITKIENFNTDAEWVVLERVIDKDFLRNKILGDSIEKLRAKIDAYDAIIRMANNMEHRKLGNPYSDKLCDASDNHCWELSGITPQSEKSITRYCINNISNPKDKAKAEKDYSKGKISMKIQNSLAAYIKELYSYKKELDDRRRDLRDIGLVRFRKIPTPTVTLHDTIPNPYNRKKLYDVRDAPYSGGVTRDDILRLDMTSEDWKWAEAEDGRVFKEEKYPIRVNYYYYTAHPQYRVIEQAVYDKNGNLKRILYLTKRGYDVYWDNMGRHYSDLGRKITILAYNNNDHDIHSAPTATQSYIKKELGLRKLTAAEKARQDKVATAMANAMVNALKDNAKYGRNTKKGRAAANKNANNFWGAVASGSSGYDNLAGNWFSQIDEDYWAILKNGPYRIERISDTSFRVVYVDENYNPIFAITRSYHNDGPYNIKENVEVEKL